MFVHDVGAGIPLVLLHGFGVDHRILLPLDETIAAAGEWRRLYLDLPGATRTPVGDVASSGDVAAAVRDELRARIGDAPFAILGNSYGGMIARHMAHEMIDQVLGLATVAGVFEPRHALRRVPPRQTLRRDDAAVAELGDDATAFREGAVIESAETARAFARFVAPGLAGADQTALARIARQYAIDPVPEDAHPDPFPLPALHITGRQDEVVGYLDALARVEHYPRGTFAALDAAGHNVHLEQLALVAALVTDWLHRVAAHQ